MIDVKTPENLPKQLKLKMDADLEMTLDLVPSGGVCFYSLNLMGQALLNRRAAQALYAQMQQKSLVCDVLVAAEAKAIGLIQELAMLLRTSDGVMALHMAQADHGVPVSSGRHAPVKP